MTSNEERRSDFIREIVQADLRSGRHTQVVTRFPPEPNGYLHIGHAKSICLNFGLALEFGGRCHLRMDDTDPTKESVDYVEAIKNDVRWLGFDWGENLFYASDYFGKLYEHAERLIVDGKAYVDSSSGQEVRRQRGTVTEAGQASEFRERSPEENLELFRRMRAGEFPDGAHVLRAKIDLASPNMKMRDPPIYRIRHVRHYRQGDAWCIYPLYDFAHGLSDELEGVTHSICTLEFENNRELYDWFIENTGVAHKPAQTEFARLNLNYTVLSKRKLVALVEGGHVAGWDDPRMPTIAGLRRRGYTAEALRTFCDRIGVAKNNSTVDVALLEHTLREDLNAKAPRVLGVLDPLEVEITTLPVDHEESFDAPSFPADVGGAGSRSLPFSRSLWIERDDYRDEPPQGWHRLAPGREVRLRHAYVIRCDDVVRGDDGRVRTLRCSHDPTSRDSAPRDGRKIAGTIHWVSKPHAVRAEVRLYDRLFVDENPGALEDFRTGLNPSSLTTVPAALVEPSLRGAASGQRFQLERLGFFVVDPDTTPDRLVLNRTVTLRDSWAKAERRADPSTAASADGPRGPARGAESRDAKPAARAPLGEPARRLVDAFGLSGEQARTIAGDPALSELFEQARTLHDNAKGLATWIAGDVARAAKSGAGLRFGANHVAELVRLMDQGAVTARAAKDVFAEMERSGEAPATLVARLDLSPVLDEAALERVVEEVLAADPTAVERYRAGNPKVFGAFIGMVMRKTGGRADPKLVGELVKKKLG